MKFSFLNSDLMNVKKVECVPKNSTVTTQKTKTESMLM